jgi:hypothetical protein
MSKSISPKLPISTIKKVEGFEHLTDEQAEEIRESLYQFSCLTYEIYRKELDKPILNEIETTL